MTPLLYQSYDEQQYDEITTLLESVVTKDMPILMGDFNHGPASSGGIIWELPFHYGLMTARGFYSPYVFEDGRCTFCSTNPTANILSDKVIDHIYLSTSMNERVISSRVSYKICNGSFLITFYSKINIQNDNCLYKKLQFTIALRYNIFEYFAENFG